MEKRTYIYSSKITYINYGEEAQNLDPDLLTANAFMNTSWQTAYLEATNGTYTLAKDLDGNQLIVFNLPPLSPGRSATISYSIRLEERTRSPPEVAFASSGNLSDIPEELREKYGRAEGSWPINEALMSLANTVWASQGRTTNVLRIATGIADWIGNNIKSVNHDIPYYPSETYLSLEGDCDDQSDLLIALLRTLGVPAYLQVGSMSWSSQTETYWSGHVTSNLKDVSYHAWAVVYVPPWGWLPFDTALGWSSSNSLSVIRSAKVWSLDTMPILNVITSDWPGAGRTLKAKVMASQMSIYYNDALDAQEGKGFLQVLIEWPFWNAVAVVLFVSMVAVAIYTRKPKSFNSDKFTSSRRFS